MNDDTSYIGGPAGKGRRPWRLLLVLGILAAVFLSGRGAAPNFDGWETSYREALAKASAGSANLLVAFYMDGCGYCDAMDRTVLNRSSVRSKLEHFVPVRVNMEQDREVANRFGVMGAPTFAVVSPDGAMLDVAIGYHTEEQFVGFLNRNVGLPLSQTALSEPARDGS